MNGHQMNRHHKETKRPTGRHPKPLPCLADWEFWRFLMAALSLTWEVVKTFWR